MQQGQSGQQATGTRDQTYDVISVLYHSLQGAETIQTYLQDAREGEIRSFFEEALNQQRQLADRAKQLLVSQLQNEGGQSGSAFGFGQGSSSDQFGGSSPSQNEPSLAGQGGGIGGSSSGGSGGGSF